MSPHTDVYPLHVPATCLAIKAMAGPRPPKDTQTVPFDTKQRCRGGFVPMVKY